MSDPVSKIRHDYHAAHHSGTRSKAAIHYIVVHDGEAPSKTGAAEGMGRWFESQKSGGSTHFGVDNDSTQQYLPLTVVSWGAPPLNEHGVHIECAGKASFTRAEWLAGYLPMLERLGWLLAYLHKQLGIPLKPLTQKELKAAGANPSTDKGIVTHVQVSRVFRRSTHTDPGPGFPLDVVMAYAKKYAGHTPQKRPKVAKRVTTKPGAHLRLKASVRSTTLRVLPERQRLTVLPGSTALWIHCRVDGVSGYVWRAYTKAVL